MGHIVLSSCTNRPIINHNVVYLSGLHANNYKLSAEIRGSRTRKQANTAAGQSAQPFEPNCVDIVYKLQLNELMIYGRMHANYILFECTHVCSEWL